MRLKGIRVERSRQFGDVYLALALWRGTGLGDLCSELLLAGKEQVLWEKMAAVLIAHCADTGATTILCRSADRKNKEQAMHEKFSRRRALRGAPRRSRLHFGISSRGSHQRPLR